MRTLLFFAVLILMFPALSHADEQLRVGSLFAELRSTEDGFDLTISADTLPPGIKAKAFFIPSPGRLVLDISPPIPVSRDAPGKKFSKEYPLQTAGLLRLRIGQSPERLRIVVDLGKNMEVPAEDLKSEISGSSIRVIARGVTLPSQTPSPTNTATTTTATTTSLRPVPSTSSSTTTARTTTTRTTTTKTTTTRTTTTRTTTTTNPTTTTTLAPVPPVPGGKSVFQKISFTLPHAGAPGEPREPGKIILQFNHRVNYTFLKKGDREVSLIFEEVKSAGDYLMLEQFPPAGFNGVEAVVPKSASKDLELSIILEPKFHLDTTWENTSLVIKPQHSE